MICLRLLGGKPGQVFRVTGLRDISKEMTTERGAFIVFEGCDRSGKSTQCLKLMEYLKNHNINTELITFPNRLTSTGRLINDYLNGSKLLDDHVIHLLFSANRWEMESEIQKKLNAGITLVCDRYSYSGVAYSSAKSGMDINWCMAPEAGLPKPDVVIFLELNEEIQIKRSAYGEERYEKPLFQMAVKKMYSLLRDKSWATVDGCGSIEEVHNRITPIALKIIKDVCCKEISKLW